MSLRIITGLRKGHKLKGPIDDRSRPTEDRIKENIFNIIGQLEEDSVVLDLFSCTGNIGLEFLSRGAKKAYLSEFDKHNLRLMQENIEHTKFTDQAVIMPGDFRKNLGQIRENIDYVYLDPPYKSEYYENSFELMLKSDFFKGTLFIVEVDADIDFSKTFDQLEIVYEKKYGRKYIRFYREK